VAYEETLCSLEIESQMSPGFTVYSRLHPAETARGKCSSEPLERVTSDDQRTRRDGGEGEDKGCNAEHGVW
jgi:hypothetical protein